VIIYKITNIINNKTYVGQTTCTIKNRFAEHVHQSKNRKDMPVLNAIRKYGKDNFVIESLCFCENQVDLDKKVIEIKKLLCVGEKVSNISKLYGVKYDVIYRIKSGRTWKSVVIPA